VRGRCTCSNPRNQNVEHLLISDPHGVEPSPNLVRCYFRPARGYHF
jgi:hypothetical protein